MKCANVFYGNYEMNQKEQNMTRKNFSWQDGPVVYLQRKVSTEAQSRVCDQ